MASAVFEALEDWPEAQALNIRVLPGITAMLAAAAALGAPLGHDFCCINLSDNLKPWDLIEKRLRRYKSRLKDRSARKAHAVSAAFAEMESPVLDAPSYVIEAPAESDVLGPHGGLQPKRRERQRSGE